MIEIIYKENENQSVALDNEIVVGQCLYIIKEDGKWHIHHTRVREEYGGQGIAKRLVLKIIEEARRKGVKIVPVCSYAQRMMVGNKEFEDVL